MATIYPSYITKDSPRGEQLVFSILNNHPSTENWVVLHSFNLPNHGKRRRGEIDFVIMIPQKGIIALEIKSHDYVARQNGLWVYGDEAPTRRSPFEQAESGMYAFQNRVGEVGKGAPFCSAVAFTDTRFAEPAVEWEHWQVIDKSDMTPDSFIEKLLFITNENLRVLNEMKFDDERRGSVTWFEPMHHLPSESMIRKMAQMVRGDFEIHVDPRDLHKEREAEYKLFLQEQFEAVDAMIFEEKIFFEGPAGTGKTLLAIEEARRAVSRSERTLFLCYNRLLGQFLKQSSDGENLFRGTLHSFIRRSEAFHESVLPQSPSEFLELANEVERLSLFSSSFDTIIVDEVQDFCSIGADDFLRALIQQNPDAKVRLFGDFENQTIQVGHSVSREQFIEKFSNIRSYRLTRNCRNRPGVGTAIELYTQKRDLYLGYRLPETSHNLKNVVAETEKEMLSKCETEFLRLAKKYLPSEIVILGVTREVATENVSGNLSKALTNDYSLWKDSGSKSFSTTVRKFKGLDAQAVILAYLPEKPDLDLLYTGMSRAIEEVVLIAPRLVHTQFLGLSSA